MTTAEVSFADWLVRRASKSFATSNSDLPNASMELLPAHPPLEDDSDEELSDQQIRELLNEAAERMRAKAVAVPDAPFRLPKLRPGHVADTYEKTEGNITRLDHSKLIDKKQLALANSIKKIDDPIADKRKRKQVRTAVSYSPVMIIYPKLFPDADWGSVLDALLHHLMVFIHSYTEASTWFLLSQLFST